MIAACKKIFECINGLVCITELNTGKLVFLNQAGKELLQIKSDEDWLGKNCHDFLEFDSTPLPQDAKGSADDEPITSGTAVVKSSGTKINIVSTSFVHEDTSYQIVAATESYDAAQQQDALNQVIENEVLVTEALSVAMAKEDPDDAIDSLLKNLGEGFDADRSYIFEENEEGNFDNTYEWCREGVTPEIDNLQNVPKEALAVWNQAFDRQGYLFIKDLDRYKDIDPAAYEILEPQGIHSLVASPFATLANKHVGFFGVDNPDIEKLENNETILTVLGHFISSLIMHRKIIGRLQYVSERDDLTNAYSRTSAMRLLGTIHEGEPYTMLLLDIDHFKDINEICGARFGDHVLKQFATKLNDYLDDYRAFVARYGSDEFLVVLRGEIIGADDPFIENLRRAVRTPMEIGTATVSPTISIGITYSSGNANVSDKVVEATRALREAKRLGRANTMVFTDQMRKDMEGASALKVQVRTAMVDDGFYMLYQPKVSVETLEVTGYEALVRMKDSNISPAVFIPIALENGWLREIGRTTTEKTIAEIGKWQSQGVDVKPVSINFSSVQVIDTGYFDFLMSTLDKHHVSPEYLQIEITEQVMMEFSERALRLVSRLHEAGIKLLLDDFGTGYSSLSYMNYIPLDTIKLDKSFADNILDGEKNRNMVKDIILMGHDQGMHITAEGVETKEQFDCLKELHADSIQGYFFSKLLLPEDAVKFAANHCAKQKLDLPN